MMKSSSSSSLPYMLLWQRSFRLLPITMVLFGTISFVIFATPVKSFVPAANTHPLPSFHRTKGYDVTTAAAGILLFASTEEESMTGGTTTSVTDEKNEAQKLLDKAAALRAEIAKMEGKTIDQVNAEAQEKKDQEEVERKRMIAKKEQERVRRQEETISGTDSYKEKISREGRMIQLPTNVDDMIRQAARSIERAFQDGQTRQTVRFNLVDVTDGQRRQPSSQMIFDGSYIDPLDDTNEWPGGAKQMYRESAKPLTTALLREIRAPTNQTAYRSSSKLPPKVIEQDIWDFDGSAIHTAESCEGPSGDVQALVFPNTDVKYIRDIEEISSIMKERLFLLINPFWKNIDSWSFNLLAPNAKQRAQDVIFGGVQDQDEDNDESIINDDNNTNEMNKHKTKKKSYIESYVLMVFSCRGEKCIALKSYPYDWQYFAILESYDNTKYNNNNNNQDSIIKLGSGADEPTSSYITKLINERPEFKETKTMRQMKNTRMF